MRDHWNWNHEARECGVCHRIGYRAFVIYGSEGWRCLHESACRRRADEREAVARRAGVG